MFVSLISKPSLIRIRWKLWPTECTQDFKMVPWPCFWPHMTHIRTWPRNHCNKYSDQVWWESDENYDLQSEHKNKSAKCCRDRESDENYGLQRANKISKWHCDLVFDPTWPIFEPALEINETNIPTKFDKNQMKTMAYREWIRFQNGTVT